MNELNSGFHFKKGSAEPDWPDDGRLRLYSMRFCPFAARVHLVLNIKKIPYNVAYVELKERPDWLYSKSPKGKVPALELPNGEKLVESLVISDFLDEQFPEVPLHSKNPLQKAKDKLALSVFSEGILSISRIIFGKSNDQSKDAQKALKAFNDFDIELKRRGTDFFYGERPGMLDLMIWPWFVKLPILARTLNSGSDIKKFPSLEKWKNLMLQQEAVKGFYISPEQNDAIFTALMEGNYPPYDLIAAKASL